MESYCFNKGAKGFGRVWKGSGVKVCFAILVHCEFYRLFEPFVAAEEPSTPSSEQLNIQQLLQHGWPVNAPPFCSTGQASPLDPVELQPR